MLPVVTSNTPAGRIYISMVFVGSAQRGSICRPVRSAAALSHGRPPLRGNTGAEYCGSSGYCGYCAMQSKLSILYTLYNRPYK